MSECDSTFFKNKYCDRIFVNFLDVTYVDKSVINNQYLYYRNREESRPEESLLSAAQINAYLGNLTNIDKLFHLNFFTVSGLMADYKQILWYARAGGHEREIKHLLHSIFYE